MVMGMSLPMLRESNFLAQMIRLRQLQGLRQTDLAKALRERHDLKFHQQTIQRIEDGQRAVRLDEAYAIADVLGVSLETMSSTVSASDAEVRFSIDRLRDLLRDAHDDLSQTYATVLDGLGPVIAELHERLPQTPARLDALTRWLLHNATLAASAAEGIREVAGATGAAGGHPFAEYGLETEEYDVLFDTWLERFDADRLSVDEYDTPAKIDEWLKAAEKVPDGE